MGHMKKYSVKYSLFVNVKFVAIPYCDNLDYLYKKVMPIDNVPHAKVLLLQTKSKTFCF